MKVSEAVLRRRSTRSFLPDPVSNQTLERLLVGASRAPSGGNLQPWRVFVINGSSMPRFLDFLKSRPPFEEPGYDIYPPNLWEPYRTNRFTVGETLYAAIGIPREDKQGRMAQLGKNMEFFGAPAAIFCFIDKGLGQPQWSDLGMFLQTFMLLAAEEGLDTCAQEYWTLRHQAVSDFVGADPDLMLFCGVAIGKADATAPINSFSTQRQPLGEWAEFV